MHMEFGVFQCNTQNSMVSYSRFKLIDELLPSDNFVQWLFNYLKFWNTISLLCWDVEIDNAWHTVLT